MATPCLIVYETIIAVKMPRYSGIWTAECLDGRAERLVYNRVIPSLSRSDIRKPLNTGGAETRSLSIVPAALIAAALVLSVTGHGYEQGNETDGGTTGGCCAIASAYDATDHDDLDKIREFRDDYLMTNLVGRGLVALYYDVFSPPVAKFIDDHPSVKPLARAALAPVVAVSAVAVDTTPAEKAVIAGLLVLVSAVFIRWLRRRRSGEVQRL